MMPLKQGESAMANVMPCFISVPFADARFMYAAVGFFAWSVRSCALFLTHLIVFAADHAQQLPFTIYRYTDGRFYPPNNERELRIMS
jgi:hypothetical protein